MRTGCPSASSASLRAAGLLLGGALLLACAVPAAVWARLPDLCPIHRLTGLACPTCGMTRAWAALAHGDWAGAFRCHALAAPALLALLGAFGRGLWTGGWPRAPHALLWGAGGLWAAYAAGRMAGLFLAP